MTSSKQSPVPFCVRTQNGTNPSHDVLRDAIDSVMVDLLEDSSDMPRSRKIQLRRNKLLKLVEAHTEEKVREARNDMYQDLISEASIYYEQGHTFDYEKAMKAYVTNKGKGDK